MGSQPHVGTLREKHLHAALKRWYAQPGDRVEVPVDGFVIDLVRDDLLVEVQTRGFSSMRRKLEALLPQHHVHVLHPIAATKWIVKVDHETGEVLSRRRSPKRGQAVDLFAELVSFPELVAHAGLSLEVLLVHEEELRHHEPGRAWRRRGWVVDERRLLEVVDRVVVDSPGALARLLPADLPAAFTTADLAAALGRPRRLAQQMAYCLRRVGEIEQVGKDGNAASYAVTGAGASTGPAR